MSWLLLPRVNVTKFELGYAEAKYAKFIAIAIGMWIDPGILSVIYLFLVLVLTASFLAEQIETKLNEIETN